MVYALWLLVSAACWPAIRRVVISVRQFVPEYSGFPAISESGITGIRVNCVVF
ncbi:MAG: hypothetical protein ACK5DM_15745 [Planctomyces sp.]